MEPGWMEKVRTLADSVCETSGLSLFDLDCRLSGRRWWVGVTIDREDGPVGIEDCESVSRALSLRLDVEDVIPHSYQLEVSSPGVERPLRVPKDYDRFKGRLARIVLGEEGVDAGKVVEGRLIGVEKGEVILSVNEEEVRVAIDRIKRGRLVLEFPK